MTYGWQTGVSTFHFLQWVKNVLLNKEEFPGLKNNQQELMMRLPLQALLHPFSLEL